MRHSSRVRQWVMLATVICVFTGCASPPHRDFHAAAVDLRASATLVPGSPALLRTGAEAPLDLQSILETARVRHNVPALAAVVVHGDEIAAWGVAGVRRRGAETPVTLGDAFAIASCAKSMHAHVIAQMVQDGLLEWDRPISAYLPDVRAHSDWSRITLRHLLSHTAGVRDPIVAFLRSTYFDRRSLTERRAVILHRLLKSRAAATPGTSMEYGNADYIMAAAVAEAVAKRPWEQLVSEHIFRRLGMQRAGFGPPGEPGEITEPWGHGKFRLLQFGIAGRFAFDPGSRSADYNAMASPAGFVHLSLTDWAGFASLHLRGHASNPHRQARVLAVESFDALHQALPGVGYVGGWFVETRPWAKGDRTGDIGRVLYHLGQNGRWTSAAWLAPEIDLAFLVITNQGDSLAAVDDVSGRLVKSFAQARRRSLDQKP